MSPKEAIQAYTSWKLRIRSLLSSKSRKNLVPSIIERDNVCECSASGSLSSQIVGMPINLAPDSIE